MQCLSLLIKSKTKNYFLALNVLNLTIFLYKQFVFRRHYHMYFRGLRESFENCFFKFKRNALKYIFSTRLKKDFKNHNSLLTFEPLMWFLVYIFSGLKGIFLVIISSKGGKIRRKSRFVKF